MQAITLHVGLYAGHTRAAEEIAAARLVYGHTGRTTVIEPCSMFACIGDCGFVFLTTACAPCVLVSSVSAARTRIHDRVRLMVFRKHCPCPADDTRMQQ